MVSGLVSELLGQSWLEGANYLDRTTWVELLGQSWLELLYIKLELEFVGDDQPAS